MPGSAARFPGIVKSVNKTVGQSVRAGEVLATLDRNITLQDYNVVSPIDGVVVARTGKHRKHNGNRHGAF